MALSTLRASAAALALIAVVTSAAFAEEVPSHSSHVTIDLGYVSTAGNSEVQTLTGSEELEGLHGRWKLSEEVSGVWGSNHGVEDTGRYLAGLRADRNLNPRLSAYALGVWRRNTFAGIRRQVDQGVGLAVHAMIRRPHQLDLEAGVGLESGTDLAQQGSSVVTKEAFGTGTAAAHYRYYFHELTYFEANARYLHSLKNATEYEAISRTALVAPLSENLAINLAHDYTYRNSPLIGFRPWDSTFTAGIQVNW